MIPDTSNAKRLRNLARSIRRLILENLADRDANPLDVGIGLYYLKETRLYLLLRNRRGQRFETFAGFCRASRPRGLGGPASGPDAPCEENIMILECLDLKAIAIEPPISIAWSPV
jgi:hypothetical protein